VPCATRGAAAPERLLAHAGPWLSAACLQWLRGRDAAALPSHARRSRRESHAAAAAGLIARCPLKVSIIIAVYNEAPTLATLLERVWAQPLAGIGRELVIVESNSSDGSRAIAQQFHAQHAGDDAGQVQLIYQDAPRGKGNAIRQGLAAATGDIFLIQDADLEYDVADYPDLLMPIVQGRTALVLGSRHMGLDSWKIRVFAHHGMRAACMNLGGRLFHGFFNLMFGSRLTDPTTMYKVFRADCLEGITLRCDRFDFDFELLGKLLRAGFVPLEVPVSYKSRGFDAGKKIRFWRDPLTWVIAIVSTRLASGSLPAARATAKSPQPAHRHETS
jgi:glycosyltransferase involved in cell wall biosynthesis